MQENQRIPHCTVATTDLLGKDCEDEPSERDGRVALSQEVIKANPLLSSDA